MKNIKNLLFLSIFCSIVVFTYCVEDSEDVFILDNLNGYYIPININPSILEFKDGHFNWSVLIDSCRYDNMKDLTLDTITNHTSNVYTGIYQVSGWNKEKEKMSNFLKFHPSLRSLMEIHFAPKILKSEDYYLRLTITGTENGINFIIEPGRWDPSTPCFTNLNPNILEGDLCMKVERSWSFEYKSNNVQLKIDDFLETSDYCF